MIFKLYQMEFQINARKKYFEHGNSINNVNTMVNEYGVY